MQFNILSVGLKPAEWLWP